MTYRLYGYLVKSEIGLWPCPQFKSAKKPDLVIKLSDPERPNSKPQWLHTQRYDDGRIYARFYQLSTSFLVRLPGLGEFFLSPNGAQIHCSFNGNLGTEDKVVALIHHVLPLAISLKGQLVLHAATIVAGNSAQLVIGDAGIGKSTFAHYMHKRGYKVYSDDAVRLLKARIGFEVAPSNPLIRVWRHNKKVNFFLPGRIQRSVKVRGIYLLQPARGRGNWLQPVRPMQALEALLAQIFRLNIVSSALNQNEMQTMMALCSKVPVYYVQYSHTSRSLRRLRNRLVSGD